MKKQDWIQIGISAIVALVITVGALFAFDVPVVQGVTNFDSLTLSENLIVGGTSAITGATTQTGAFAANGGITVDSPAFSVADTSGNTVVGGTLAANGGFSVDSPAFTVADTSGNTVIAGTLAANGGITVDTSNFTVNGTTGALLTASTFSAGDKSTFNGEVVYATSEITPASGSSLTVGYTAYLINTSGNITMTLATTGATAGQIVIIYGLDANNITINDTNLKSSDGNTIVLGQYDICIFFFDGTSWVELSKTANS